MGPALIGLCKIWEVLSLMCALECQLLSIQNSSFLTVDDCRIPPSLEIITPRQRSNFPVLPCFDATLKVLNGNKVSTAFYAISSRRFANTSRKSLQA